MAFELWPPSTPPLPLRRIDQNVLASPSPVTKSKKQVPLAELFQGLPAEERIRKLQEYQMAKNRTILSALETRRPRKSMRSLESPGFRCFHDATEGILGCNHYQTNVSLSAPCCGEFYACRFCHDEKQPDHVIDRKCVDRMRCMNCGHIQSFVENKELDSRCESCHGEFARYFCPKCKFFDNAERKAIFHCDDCGVCRIGCATDFFHCKGCNVCINIDLKNRHKCVESAASADCPVCSAAFESSPQAASILTCGHMIHTDCLEQYRKTNYRCPTCKKSFGDVKTYFAEIDRIMKSSRVPVQFVNAKAIISCTDCERRSVAPYHFMYHKCSHCGSYNTSVLEQLRQ